MLSIKCGSIIPVGKAAIIYIPLCYLLNSETMAKKFTGTLFTFHYVIY